ncbi:MAG: radical SAM protein [Lysobacterales bacterium]
MNTDSRQRPYLFYGQTQSLCEQCLVLVPAKIVFMDECVFYLKRCPQHGSQKTLVSTDIPYFLKCKEYLKPGDIPHQFQTRIERGCPYDCGLCPDHEQHSCLAIFDIIDECNMRCPICYADSAPHRGNPKSMQQIQAMLNTLLASEITPDLVQVSGGEPTLHPEILDILSLIHRSEVRHLMLNTNGIRIAREPAFADQLAKFNQGFEVYLQFDSLKADALRALRGIDARRTREDALKHLEQRGISTTLVCTVQKGVNDHEIDDLIAYALKWRCVRGITFQPIQRAGRTENFAKPDRFTLSDIRTQIASGSNAFSDDDLLPLPCHPENICIGYALRNSEEPQQLAPISGLISRETLLSGTGNTITFETSSELKDAFLDTFSLDALSPDVAERLQTLLCCLPRVEAPDLSYENVFRVVIMSFLDAHDFCISSVKRSCVHFVTPQGKIYPFDTYNLFYRDRVELPGVSSS